MKCPNCGEELVKNQETPEIWECSNCGKKIKLIDETPAEEINENDNVITSDNEVIASNDISEKSNDESIKSNRRLFLIGGIVIVAAVIVIIIAAVIIGNNKKNFNKLYSYIATETWCTISDDGSYMKIDTNPYDIEDDFETMAYSYIKIVNEDLGFSDALLEKMGETSALDGRQTEQNDKVTISWKYHPDNGLEVTYEWN